MMVGLRIGALQIIHPKYDPEQVLTSIRDFRPTYFPAVPTVFVSLLNHPNVSEYGLDQVRLFNSGGAPCPVEVMEEFKIPPSELGRLRGTIFLAIKAPVEAGHLHSTGPCDTDTAVQFPNVLPT